MVIDVPPGWDELVAQFLLEAKQEAIQKGIEDSYHIYYIKEKWGELQIYDNYDLDCTEKYITLSQNTCTRCGKAGQRRTIYGWIIPYCDECYAGWSSGSSFGS